MALKLKTKIPGSVVKAFSSEQKAKILPWVVKGSMVPDSKQLLDDTKNDFSLELSSTGGLFILQGNPALISFDVDDAKTVKYNVTIQVINHMINAMINGMIEPVKHSMMSFNDMVAKSKNMKISGTETGHIPAEKVAAASDAIHAQIAKEASGALSIPPLADATEFYQQVQGSDSDSRYVYIAKRKGGPEKLAVRLLGSKVSVRMEPYSDNVLSQMQILGVTNSGGAHASTHFECPDEIGLKRYMVMLAASLTNWEVAEYDEDKIRKLGA